VEVVELAYAIPAAHKHQPSLKTETSIEDEPKVWAYRSECLIIGTSRLEFAGNFVWQGYR
jgi:hypothetical protein